MSTTSQPWGSPCSRCLSFPCRCTSGPVFYNPPSPAPAPDWSFQMQVTGLLMEITKQLAELADAVHKIAQALADSNQDQSQP